jgi:hypothetical protein
MSESRTDNVFFSVSAKHKEILRKLTDELFETEASAFSACVALAVAKNLTPIDVVRGQTTWNAGTMNELVTFVSWKFKTDKPVNLSNKLGAAGIEFLASQIDAGLLPHEILFPLPE